jgi:hypothetical protein
VKFGISNLVLQCLTLDTKDKVLECSEVCDFAPTAFYGGWERVPNAIPRRPYGSRGPIVSALQSLFFAMPDASIVKDDIKFQTLALHFERLATLAENSSVPFLIYGSPGTRSNRSKMATDEKLTSRLQTLGAIAAAHGVKLCFEVNSPKFGCEYIFENRALLELIEGLRHPGLGLHLDVGQILEEGIEPIGFICSAERSLVHLHLSAPDFTCRLDLMPLYDELLTELKRRQCKADVIFEVQNLGESSEREFTTACMALAVKARE